MVGDPEQVEEAPVERPVARAPRGGRSRALMSLAAVLVLILAGLGGVALAYFVSAGASVPPPIAGSSPTAPIPTPPPSLSPSPSPTATPSSSPVATATTTPLATPLIHVVAAGENLTVIARRYGVTVQAIVEANGLEDPNSIRVGQELVIPPPVPGPTPSLTPDPTA